MRITVYVAYDVELGQDPSGPLGPPVLYFDDGSVAALMPSQMAGEVFRRLGYAGSMRVRGRGRLVGAAPATSRQQTLAL